jgi:hydroxymethylglutaryl-CoA synthase
MGVVTRQSLYLPKYRLETDLLREYWGGGSSGVKRKVVQAADDEPVTLGIRAAKAVVDDPSRIDSVFFATSTPTYQYGYTVPVLCDALGLAEDTYVQMFSHSTRAGTAALRAAHDAVASDSADVTLVVASEAPAPAPGSDREKTAGAGASALVVESEADDGLQARRAMTATQDLNEEWQPPDEATRRAADKRFTREAGYIRTLERVLRDVMDDEDWDSDDVDVAVVNHPNPKFLSRLTSTMGLTEQQIATHDFADRHGDLGSASTFAVLAQTDLPVGSNLLVGSYGTGTADAIAYEVTGDGPVRETTAQSIEHLNYVEYLKQLDKL